MIKVKLSKGIKEAEVPATNVSGFHKDREESDPTPEAMGQTVWVVVEDLGIDGSTVCGVFDTQEAAMQAGEGMVKDGAIEYYDVYSFNLNQAGKRGVRVK